MGLSKSGIQVFCLACLLLWTYESFRSLHPHDSCCLAAGTPILYETGETSTPEQRHELGELHLLWLRTLREGLTLGVYLVSMQDGSESVWESRDRGYTWKQTFQELQTNLGHLKGTFLEAGSDARVLYRPHEGGLPLFLRSDDGGDTWELPEFKIEDVSWIDFGPMLTNSRAYKVWFDIVAIHPTNAHTVYATIRLVPWFPSITGLPEVSDRFLQGLYVSHNGGDHWTRLTAENLRHGTPIGISQSDPTVMYGHGYSGIIKSVDGGKTWSAVGQQSLLELPIQFKGELPGVQQRREIRLEVKQIAVDPTNPDVVFVVSNKGLFRSLDGGASWCLLRLGIGELDSISSVAINPQNTMEIFAGTKSGVFRSTDHGCRFKQIFPN